MKKSQKLVTVVIRGCIFRVPKEKALEIERREREVMRQDWNTNRVD